MSTVEIPVTGGHIAIVDAEDADLVSAYNWAALPTGRTVYAQRALKKSDGRWTTQKMHTLITGYALTDHRNGIGLDNRRANLREATHAQNLRNIRIRPGVSGFKGVTWWEMRGVWKAQIRRDGRSNHIGYFANAHDAALAYDEAARRIHGEFATLNFPRPGERAGRITEQENA